MKRIFTLLILFALTSASLAGFAQSSFETGGQPERQDLSKAVQIFPNPAIDFVHIRLDHVKSNELRIQVYNIIGNQVSAETEVIDEHEIRVRVKDLDVGYYLLAVKDEHAKFQGTYKFLKR